MNVDKRIVCTAVAGTDQMIQKLLAYTCPVTNTRIVIITDSRGTEHVTLSTNQEIKS